MTVLVASDWIEEGPDELEVDDWWLSDPLDATTPLIVGVAAGWRPETEREAGVFYPKGDTTTDARRAIVVWGETYGIKSDLALWALDRSTFDAVKALLLSERVLLLRNPWGDRYYLAVSGNVSEDPLRAAPNADEPYRVRHAHRLSCPVVEVAQP